MGFEIRGNNCEFLAQKKNIPFYNIFCNIWVMQKLLLIFILFVSKIIFVSTSFAEWIPVLENNSTGTTFYIEDENIRVDEG